MANLNSTNLIPIVDPSLHTGPSLQELEVVVRHVEHCHAGVIHACYEGVVDAYDAGTALNCVKSCLSHGDFLPWLQSAFGAGRTSVSVKTCQRYMKVASLLTSLPEFPATELEDSTSKATRASQIEVLAAYRLNSIRKVLALAHMNGTKASDPEPLAEVPEEPTEFTSRIDNDWLTPPQVVACASELFGSIDLDPCGVDDPRFHLPANITLTASDDSLSPGTGWRGRIFLHPPATNVAPFVERAARAVQCSEADEALLLLPADTDAEHMAVIQPFAKGFLHHRPTFVTPDATLVRPPFPYMFVYLALAANRIEKFGNACGPMADIYLPHRF